MKISELIASTKKVKNRGNFANKPFGEIYASDKRVNLNDKDNILTVSMLIKAVTDKIDGKPVAAHKVMIRISNIKAEALSFNEVVDIVRNAKPEYANKEEYKDDDLVQIALDKKNNIFQDKTLFKKPIAGYSLISDKIPDNSQIQVWCSCSDYYWTFQYYNVEEGVDISNHRRNYSPKTVKGWIARKSDEPLRNPGKHPGMCKHLMLLLSMLMDEEIVEATNNSSKSILNQYVFNIDRFQTIGKLSKNAYTRLENAFERDKGRQDRRRRRMSKASTKSNKAHYWASHNKFNAFKGWKSK